MSNQDEYIEVPVTRNFDYEDVVGSLRILKSAIPITSNFCFSIGYTKISEYDYSLVTISLIHNLVYRQYLDENLPTNNPTGV
jgi:hypothetical protein